LKGVDWAKVDVIKTNAVRRINYHAETGLSAIVNV